MSRHVRIYVEGGGDFASGLSACRTAFVELLRPIQEEARMIGSVLDIVAAGGRAQAFDKFLTAIRVSPDRVNLLLVDAEDAVMVQNEGERFPTWSHLRARDGWNRPNSIKDDRALLMIQAMEAWLMVDVGALQSKFGKGFDSSVLPRRPICTCSRAELVTCLEKATKKCKSVFCKREALEVLRLVDVNLLSKDDCGRRAIELIRQHLGLRLPLH